MGKHDIKAMFKSHNLRMGIFRNSLSSAPKWGKNSNYAPKISFHNLISHLDSCCMVPIKFNNCWKFRASSRWIFDFFNASNWKCGSSSWNTPVSKKCNFLCRSRYICNIFNNFESYSLCRALVRVSWLQPLKLGYYMLNLPRTLQNQFLTSPKCIGAILMKCYMKLVIESLF